MNPTPDTAASAGNGRNFDTRQAAALLDQTTHQARRKLAPSPPWLLAIRAIAVLAALGGIWLTVRGQHPYRGPTVRSAAIPVLIRFVVLRPRRHGRAVDRERAMAGVRGRRPGCARPRSVVLTLAVHAPCHPDARAHVGSCSRRRGELSRPIRGRPCRPRC